MLRSLSLCALLLLVGLSLLAGCSSPDPYVITPILPESGSTPNGAAGAATTPATPAPAELRPAEATRQAGMAARAEATAVAEAFAQAQATVRADATARAGTTSRDEATARAVATAGPAVTPTPESGNATPAGNLSAPFPAPVLPTEQWNSLPIPLIDMAGQNYFGFEGGLYPGGLNEMPAEHALAGLQRALAVQPRDLAGNPDPTGQAILLSVGMSNTTMEFCRALGTNSPTDGVTCVPQSFMGLASADPSVNTNGLMMVNGALGGQIADTWDTPNESNYDRIRDDILGPLGLSEQQVQVVWLKVTDRTDSFPPTLPDPNADAFQLAATMGDIVRSLKQRYPHLQQVFISSRVYAGNATRDINPEPYAYETGYAVKWLIESQINQMAAGSDGAITPAGDLNYNGVAPWLAWGPYLWADGTNPRSDGLVWLPEDFGNDGTHPSVQGREKVGGLLLDFFKTSPYTGCWFMAEPDGTECAAQVAELGVTPAPEPTSQPAVTPVAGATASATPIAGAGPTREEGSVSEFTLSEEARPLTELGSDTYLGYEGGLYPGGVNEPPPAHTEEGLARMRNVQPLDPQGNPAPNGNIVLLSIGMSNTMMEFCGEFRVYTECEPYSFIAKALADTTVDHTALRVINGARGSQVASDWVDPNHENYDTIRDSFLAPYGLTEEQVQVVWLKATDFLMGRPPLPAENAHAVVLTSTLAEIVRALYVRYPNLQQVFLSSRIYAGYATRDLNPEPFAYESGFSVKWLIESQIDQMASGGAEISSLTGDLDYNTVAPWLAWGPYTWADGATPREADGLVWLPEDFGDDGTHPTESGRAKVADMLLNFFKTSPFTKCWFLAEPDC